VGRIPESTRLFGLMFNKGFPEEDWVGPDYTVKHYNTSIDVGNIAALALIRRFVGRAEPAKSNLPYYEIT